MLGPSPALPDDALSVPARRPQDTMALGAAVGWLLRPGDTVLLGGDLGAGKTTFTKGMARALGVSGTVTSPTFVLMHTYRTAAGWDLLHADVWRLEQLQEVIELAIPELLEEGAAAVIEWGELAAPALAPDYLYVGISFETEEGGPAAGADDVAPDRAVGESSLGEGSVGEGSVGQRDALGGVRPDDIGAEDVLGAVAGANGTRKLVFAAFGPRWQPRMAQLAEAVGAW